MPPELTSPMMTLRDLFWPSVARGHLLCRLLTSALRSQQIVWCPFANLRLCEYLVRGLSPLELSAMPAGPAHRQIQRLPKAVRWNFLLGVLSVRCLPHFGHYMKLLKLFLLLFALFIVNTHAGWKEKVSELSCGNPGALSLLYKLKKEYVEMGCADDCFQSILEVLERNDIVDYKIWLLFKDVSGENKSKFFTIINAIAMGFVSSEQVAFAINNHGQGIDFTSVEQAVSPILPHVHNTNHLETTHPITYFLKGAHK